MRFHPPEDAIELYETGFAAAGHAAAESDVLQRAELGKKLSNIVQQMDDSLTIALDSGWGTGKTWFLKHWVGAHNFENGGNALTVYISAFNHDYLEEPLTALIMAIDDRLAQEEQKAEKEAKKTSCERDKTALEKIQTLQQEWQQVKKFAVKMALPLTKIGLRIGTAIVTYGASEAVTAGIKTIEEETEQAAKTYLLEQQNKQNAMESFRTRLADFAKTQKLIIVIDELDRSRPDYALSMLETIKHFFRVDNIHFILGINMKALESMIKCCYGNEIDASGYLRRFIDLSLSLPDIVQEKGENKKAVLKYTAWAAEKMGIEPKLSQFLQNHLSCAVKHNSISLRDAGRILSVFSLIVNALGAENFLNLPMATGEICLTLLTSSIVAPAYFQKFLSATVTKEEILKYYGATEEEYKDLTTYFYARIRGQNNLDNPITKIHLIAYLQIIDKYSNITGKGLDCCNAFMWRAISNFETAALSDKLLRRDLANRLQLKNYSLQLPLPLQIYSQYLEPFNLDLPQTASV